MMNGASQRAKALPPKPGQDLGYNGGQGGYGGTQNGYRNENADSRNYNAGQQNGRIGGPQEPSGRTILEGYRKDIMNGFEDEKPRYNPVSYANFAPVWNSKNTD